MTSFPDPLVARDGTKITTKEQWETKRKPELRALFQHYMYGKQPAKPTIKVKELVKDEKALGGAATLREFAIDVGLPTQVNLLVVTPNAASGKVPCFLALNFYGNHQVLNHPGIALPKTWVRRNKGEKTGGVTAREQDRGRQEENWSIAQTIARGYAFATFFQSDIVPDDKELAEPALRTLAGNSGPERGDADTATIMAWAWGFSRMLDALEQLPEVDATRVATMGHSRNGKTALVAVAFDDRFAMALPSQAGCGGTAPSRISPEMAKPNAKGRPTAETLAVINRAFPHWFSGHFKSFNEQPERLPFDQHSLMALCAPRPVMCSNATEDLWANPDGQFEMLKAADPVYRLVAGDGLGASTRPKVNEPLLSRLGYFIRPGVHSMTPQEWNVWHDYADKWLKR